MATTSKTSARKKTKTTRKAVRSTRPASAASTRKSTSKKTTVKKNVSSKTTTVKQESVTSSSKAIANEAMTKLRKLNLFVATVNVAQAALILWLSKAFGGIRPINASFPTNDTLASAASKQTELVTGSHRLFDVHLSWMIAAFLITSAVMHLALATWMRKRYERELDNNINRIRWATFATAGSVLLITIALTAGITDLVTLLAIFGFTVLGSLIALNREHLNQNKERSRLVYGVGAIAVAAPWLIFLLNTLGNYQYGEGGTPSYMYWIYATGAVLTLALAKNLREQTRGRGRWIDYLYAEKMYVWLNLIGYSAVTWQIYAALLKK